MDNALTTTEAQKLASLEAVVESGLKTFSEVGNALLAIRDGKLYRASHKTFEDYCQTRWGFNASRARQLIGATAIASKIESVTGVTPASERQVRPLTRLPEADRAEAWERAVDRANDEGREKPTAKDVEAVVKEIQEPKQKEEKQPKETQETKEGTKQNGSYQDWRRLRELCAAVQDAIREMGTLKVDAPHKIQARTMCEDMAERFSKLAQKLVN